MIAPIYVAAREVLLDALDALGEQRQAVILAGAQAIYLHTGDADLAVAEYTTDGDLVVDPTLLQDEPRLQAAMEAGGFRLDTQPGIWLRARLIEGVLTDVPVDLLVPDAVAGAGRRGARLGDHGDKSGRRVRGLEGALVDHSMLMINAFDPNDHRRFEIRVAGPSALWRSCTSSRIVLWTVAERASMTRTLSTSFACFAPCQPKRLPWGSGGFRLFGAVASPGTAMAVQATEGLEDPAVIAASCVALTADLLEAIRANHD